jgi:hypothetical protein
LAIRHRQVVESGTEWCLRRSGSSRTPVVPFIYRSARTGAVEQNPSPNWTLSRKPVLEGNLVAIVGIVLVRPQFDDDRRFRVFDSGWADQKAVGAVEQRDLRFALESGIVEMVIVELLEEGLLAVLEPGTALAGLGTLAEDADPSAIEAAGGKTCTSTW